jgi:hypothetical protein
MDSGTHAEYMDEISSDSDEKSLFAGVGNYRSFSVI